MQVSFGKRYFCAVFSLPLCAVWLRFMEWLAESMSLSLQCEHPDPTLSNASICDEEWLMILGFTGDIGGWGEGWASQAWGHKVQMLGLGFLNIPPNCTCTAAGLSLSKWFSTPKSFGRVQRGVDDLSHNALHFPQCP